MATCLRCLARRSINPFEQAPSRVAAFSTSACSQAQTSKPGSESRGRKALKLGKRKIESRGRVPAPGERKAIRKRIVLSNTNAYEVQGLQDWNRSNYADANTAGTMVGLPGALIDSLRSIESFKPTQGWGFFRRPATLIRKETLELAKHIQEPGNKTLCRIIVGERGSGKSVLLLQAQAAAFQAGWVVMHIPEAQDLTNAKTEYSPIDSKQPIKYAQKTYTANLLSRTLEANQSTLSRLSTTLDHQLPIPLQPDMTLDRLATLGIHDSDLSWPIFLALWQELTAPGRPGVLFTLDNLAHISRPSHYLAPDMHHIHAFDLALVNHFIAHLTGAQKLPNGGMVLAADSMSNRPLTPSLDLAVQQSEAAASRDALAKLPLHDIGNPYAKHDARVLEAIRGVPLMRLKGLDRDEAKSVLEYYAQSGMFRKTITEGLVTERWALAGGGNIGELERYSVRSHG